MIGISKKFMDFLLAETDVWVEQGIVSHEQASAIAALYEVREHSLRKILMIAGAVLLGLGGVSFIAAHWHQLPKLFRVCVIVAGYVASLCAYVFMGRGTNKTARSFLLIASLIFGSGIYLITRMYNYKLEFSELLAWWLVHLIVTALCTKDSWQVYLAQAVGLLYLNWINAIDIFALEFMSSAKVDVSLFFMPAEGFALLIALWCTRLRINDRTALNVNMLLTLLVLASRMSLCFGGTWTLIILGVAGAVMSFTRLTDVEIMGLLVMGLCGLVLTWPEVWHNELADWRNVLAVVSAVLTACVMLVNIWRGHAAIGVTFCALLVMRYFFDRLFGYMPKAWGFTIMGVVLLGAGMFFGRLRKLFESERE